MAIRMKNGDVVLNPSEAGRAAYALREQAERRALGKSGPVTIDSLGFANNARLLAEELTGLPATYLREEIAKAEAKLFAETRD